MKDFVSLLNGYVWSVPLVVLCLTAALYFSFGTRFVQVRRLKEMVKLLFAKSEKKEGGISSFQAFALALSGRIGTGNIVGVALAIGYGGPGAIVWMWIIAFFGAGTAFAEACLAQIYKQKHGDQMRGGPVFYIEKGLNCRWLAVLFAVMMVFSCSICQPQVHSNSIAASFATTFGLPTWSVGVFVAVLIALVIMGGVKRISNVAEIVTPFMAIAYILFALVLLVVNYQAVPQAFSSMIRSAFGFHEVFGGMMGAAISWGVKRGIYSNEAGQGTAPIVAAAADVDHPVKQGLVQAFSVYVDTLFVCTATALMILATDSYAVVADNGDVLHRGLYFSGREPGVGYTIDALATIFGMRWSGIIVSVTLFFFAFTTLMAYYYYAETNLVYLFSHRKQRKYKVKSCADRSFPLNEIAENERPCFNMKSEKICVWLLRFVFVVVVFVGSFNSAKTIWMLGDMGVGLTCWINIIVIILLSPRLFKVLRDYERQQKNGQKPLFSPRELNVKNADFWQEDK